MSATENQMSNTGDTPVVKKGGKKKLILLVLVLIIMLAGSGGGYYYWKTVWSAKAAEVDPAESEKKDGKKSTAKKDSAEADNGEKDATAEQEPPKNSDDPLSNALPDDAEVTKIVELPPFIVNLSDVDQARYLRMTVSLGVGGEEGGSEKPDQLFITRVRNVILAVLSEKKSGDVLTVEGKSKLRVELLKAAQAASEDPEVKAIYITDFIVQL